MKDKYNKVVENKSITATIKDFFKNLKPNMQKMLFRLKHLDESNENLAYYHFERGSINDAILRFKIVNRINKRPVYDFFIGRAYWEKKKNEEALKHINLYLESKDKEFLEEATYCKRLLEFKESEIKEVPIFIVHHNYTKFYFIFEKEFKNSLEYSPSSTFFKALEKHIVSYFLENKALRILDIGCADGVLGYCCKSTLKCQEIEGIELVEKLSAIAKVRKYKDFEVYNKVTTGDFYEIVKNFDAQYDLILAENFVAYKADIEGMISNALKLLSKGGIFAFSFREASKYDKHAFIVDDEDFAFNMVYIEEVIKKQKLKVITKEKIEYSPDNENILMILSNA